MKGGVFFDSVEGRGGRDKSVPTVDVLFEGIIF